MSLQGAARGAQALQEDILRLYFRDLCRLLDARHASSLADGALAHVGLCREDLNDATRRCSAGAYSFEAYYRSVEWLDRTQALPVVALHLGMRRSVHDYGLYGAAARSATTLGGVLRFGERFFASSWPGARLVVSRQGSWVVNRYELLPTAVCAPQPLLQLMSGASMAFTRELLPQVSTASIEMRYAFPSPPDRAAYAQALGCRVVFGCTHSALCFPVAWLDLPHRLEPARPGAQLDAQALWHAGRTSGSTTTERVLRVLQQECAAQRFPTVDQVAAQLGCSGRSLRRHLAREGTFFQRLLDDLRMDLARRYVRQTSLGSDDIAMLLGYAHASSFQRAFRVHFGQSPTSMRVTP